ncbi:hypothetical protein NM688_g997 [Phlebia brevispora]|uniref:Uncharacterized protein n=1 Tax=Phlebia brevispora TaxID=194682 RepID=A0ACC1TCE7_9APHY|nr:hypothetical protein NM688_g997 [Phlebia brevispora]
MVVPYLPPELTDQIIDYLKDDEKSLHACALTCFSWMQLTRKHIHRCIRLTERHVDVIAEIYSSRDLASLVRIIEVRCTPPHPWHMLFQADDPQPSRWLKDENTYRTLALFPRVQTYRFFSAHFSPIVIDKISSFSSDGHASLVNLELHDATFEDLEGFATLLTCFPSLSCLRIDRCQWPHVPGFTFHDSKLYDPEKGKIPGPRLRTLRVVVHSQARADIAKWCHATGIANEHLEWRWEGHAHRAIFEPALKHSELRSRFVRPTRSTGDMAKAIDHPGPDSPPNRLPLVVKDRPQCLT